MIWHFIKYWATFFIAGFYRRIQGHNIHRLHVPGPVIIAMNHPNAFTDPIMITYVAYPLRTHYLARGDAFRPGVISWLLEKIGIVPIFRIQDGGKEGLKKNDESYKRVNALLKKNAKIVVFAEGLCVQEPRLRPLKKGVARMVFGAYQELNNDRLMVIPVGVNYTMPHKFRSDILYSVGEPIYVKDFIEEYHKNPAKAQNLFLQRLYPAMKKLVTHVNDPVNDNTVSLLFQLKLTDSDTSYKKSLHKQLELSQSCAETVNRLSGENNTLLAEFASKATEYFSKLNENKIRDWLITRNNQSPFNFFNTIMRCVLLLIFAPLYLIGLGAHLPLLWITHTITKKIIRNKEFYSSFAIGIGMVVFPLGYLLYFYIFALVFHNNGAALLVCIIVGLTALLALWYHPFMLKTLGLIRVLKNPSLLREMRERRQELHSIINKF